MHIPEPRISGKQQLLEGYYKANEGFRHFFFAIGSYAITKDANINDTERCTDSDGDDERAVKKSARQNFKLDAEKNIPRSAPGRITTANGALASVIEKWKIALNAENRAQQLEIKKQMKLKERENVTKYELPVLQYLMINSIMEVDERLLKNKLNQFFFSE